MQARLHARLRTNSKNIHTSTESNESHNSVFFWRFYVYNRRSNMRFPPLWIYVMFSCFPNCSLGERFFFSRVSSELPPRRMGRVLRRSWVAKTGLCFRRTRSSPERLNAPVGSVSGLSPFAADAPIERSTWSSYTRFSSFSYTIYPPRKFFGRKGLRINSEKPISFCYFHSTGKTSEHKWQMPWLRDLEGVPRRPDFRSTGTFDLCAFRDSQQIPYESYEFNT